jgi:hypothetical protein
MIASSSTSAPVNGRLLLPLVELGSVNGNALEEVDGEIPVELDPTDGGAQTV